MATRVTARDGRGLGSRVSRLRRSRARALLSLNLKKKRDCSQSRKVVLSFPWQDQTFNNFENDTIKLSLNEAELTGLSARNNCDTIQQVLILNLLSGPKSFRAFWEKEPWGHQVISLRTDPLNLLYCSDKETWQGNKAQWKEIGNECTQATMWSKVRIR